ncbi:class II aldolase/adducin family protein [Succinatimonas hippei]|uniref:class II aldolase/adducin family protein n=1 Tax=Succinatimonas hippei TaxID=626938 RepID=UPI0020132159|nr:class II aldolase/adducin family protein [Succinatimonas hippei]MCL1603466.1 class II aldolase/adducin family protein [Succinatimonas hippei]
MNESQIRDEIIFVCRQLRKKNLVNATHGNISARFNKIMLITPTGCDLETVQPQDLVSMDIQSGEVISAGKPSKEYAMHLFAYRERPDINGIVHAHSPKSVAVGCLPDVNPDNITPAYTLAFALFTKKLPMIGYYKAGSHELAVKAVEKLKDHNAVLLAHHGLITISDTLTKAYYRLEEIEENSIIALQIGINGNKALDPDNL